MQQQKEGTSPFLKGMPPDITFIQGQKYIFKLPKLDEEAITRIASDHNLTLPVARVLFARGFLEKEQINSFLFSSYERDVAHPSILKDSEIAVNRILEAIEKKQKILIFGDYDVDGISSSAVMMSSLLPLGAQINFFLPNRARDGYGLSSKVVKKAVESGYHLIVTVDNGITAVDASRTAAKYGIDLIITDHHRPYGTLPTAMAIVNPNQDDCPYPEKGLPGVGVIFKLISWIYEKKGLPLPEKLYELVMLGTIADVVPLLGENRYWVRYGLSKINKDRSYALEVLMKNSKLQKSRISSLDIGFMIAPQLNALGRLSDPRDGVKFLISAQHDDVDRVGRVLYEMNEARKEVERAIFDAIVKTIEEKKIDLSKENVIVASAAGWPTGVIGLVAGKLMHQYGRPTLLFHETPDGMLKGSCRSIAAFNIFDALAENEKLLKSFGGHSFAAGLSLHQKDLPTLKANLEQKVAAELTPYDLLQKLEIDAELELPEMVHRLLNDMEKLEPFGHKNSQPLFLVRNVSLLQKPKLLKEKHVKCMLFSQGVIKPIIFFNRPDVYELLSSIGEARFHVAANVTKNEWNGKVNIELLGVDIALDQSDS